MIKQKAAPRDQRIVVKEAAAAAIGRKFAARRDDKKYHKSAEYKADLKLLDTLNHQLRAYYLKGVK